MAGGRRDKDERIQNTLVPLLYRTVIYQQFYKGKKMLKGFIMTSHVLLNRQVIELREYSAETNYLKNNREENREPEQEQEQEKGATPVPVQEEEQGTSRTEISQEPKKKTERRMRYT